MNLNKILRSAVIFLLFLVPIFPLIVANSYFFPFITGKAFYFRIIVEIAFFAWVILAFLDARYRPKVNALTVSVTLFAAVALIADLLGVNPIRSLMSNFERMEGWITIIHLWGFFIVASSVFGWGAHGKNTWHRWFNASMAIAVIVSIYALMQFFGAAAIHQGSSRLDASLGNSEYLAIYMLFHVGLAAYLFFVARAKKIANWQFLQYAYPVLAVLFGFILFETQTRGTILGLAGGAMLSLALYAIFAKNKSTRSRGISVAVIVLIIALGFGVWAGRNSAFIQSSPTLERMASISVSDTTTQARGYIWPMAIKGFEQKPVFGWGQENFNYIFNANYNPHMWSQEQWFDRAHDVYLDWLVAGGLVGLLAYLSLYAVFLYAVWKSDLDVTEKSVLTGLLAAYAVHNVFVFDNLASYALFFALLGFAAVLHEGKLIRGFSTKVFTLDAVEYVVAPVSIVLCAAALYFLNVRGMQANADLIAALQACNSSGQADVTLFQKALAVNSYTANQEIREQLLTCMTQVVQDQYPGPTQQAFFQLTTQQIQAQVAATPYDARAYALGGSTLNSIGQYQSALGLLETAHELSPGKQTISFQLAQDYSDAGSNDKAVELLKQTYESSPDDSQAKAAYVSALIISGQASTAKALFPGDPLFSSQQVAQAYASIKEYGEAITIYQNLIKTEGDSNGQIRLQLAQAQYTSGDIAGAVATLKTIEKDRPDLAEQIDAAIKSIQK